MNIGRLRKRVSFQRVDTTTDALGNVTANTWSTFLTVSGEFTPMRMVERDEAGRMEASVRGKLRVRSTTDTRAVTEANRVNIGGEPYQIRGIVNPDQRRCYLEMSVERGVAT